MQCLAKEKLVGPPSIGDATLIEFAKFKYKTVQIVPSFWLVVSAQLAEWSLSMPDVCGSNPAIRKII